MKHTRSIFTVLGLGVAACGGGDGATPDGPVAPPVDAMLPLDAPVAPSLVSSIPGLRLVDVGAPATPGLVLLSSNVLQTPSGGQVFQQWLAEVQNTGTTTVCQLEIVARFKTAAGAEVATFDTFADAAPYTAARTALTIGCLAPGEIGSFYDNGFVATEAPLATVTTLEVALTPQVYSDVAPAIHAPIVTSHVMPVFTSSYAVAGTLTGHGGTIYNIGITSYARDARGLVLGQLGGADLDTLDVGATFAFTTTSIDTAFTSYRLFTDYIDGPKPTAATSGPARGVQAIEATRRAHRAAVQARADQALGAARRAASRAPSTPAAR